eukprot:1923651-Pleurochrysis_carterae.AAC.2
MSSANALATMLLPSSELAAPHLQSILDNAQHAIPERMSPKSPRRISVSNFSASVVRSVFGGGNGFKRLHSPVAPVDGARRARGSGCTCVLRNARLHRRHAARAGPAHGGHGTHNYAYAGAVLARLLLIRPLCCHAGRSKDKGCSKTGLGRLYHSLGT